MSPVVEEAGALVALAPKAAMFASLGECLKLTRATHLLATPSLFATLTFLPEQLPDLKCVALGGEAMLQSIVDGWADALTLVSTYGVTECTVYQTVNVIKGRKGNPRLLGRPLGDTRVMLVGGDGSDETCLIEAGRWDGSVGGDGSDETRLVEAGSGEEGEVWLAGNQVGLGYLNAPELTAAKFLTSPTLGRCFRTGDVARATKEGLVLLGRRDTQIKINGKRADVTEVENAISSGIMAPLIAASAVVMREGRLVASGTP
ncbi:hypothetical protein T484DRAFT_1782381 [Baffinella frigidus]|nr:hypothetical protein T484DRAFT_1782381 [Cryptophyta sp. CCMP2293]